MNEIEFLDLYAKYIAIKDTYFTEARKTSIMLGECLPQPLSFRKRFALLSQEIVEKDAHSIYLEAKRRVHRTALLGYEAVSQDSTVARYLEALKA